MKTRPLLFHPMRPARVYVVEQGAYEQRGIVGVFATRELAETYVIEAARGVWEPDPGWSIGIGRGHPFPERGDLSFDEWCRVADSLTWEGVGVITEYDVEETLPPVTKDAWRAANGETGSELVSAKDE